MTSPVLIKNKTYFFVLVGQKRKRRAMDSVWERTVFCSIGTSNGYSLMQAAGRTDHTVSVGALCTRAGGAGAHVDFSGAVFRKPPECPAVEEARHRRAQRRPVRKHLADLHLLPRNAGRHSTLICQVR